MIIHFGFCDSPLTSTDFCQAYQNEKIVQEAKKANGLVKFVKQETNLLYFEGVKEIIQRGIIVKSIIFDGRKGLLTMFGDIPVLYCQFHQVKTIMFYLTKRPKLQASIALWLHVLILTQTDKESFVGGLNNWYLKWGDFLNERKIDENGKKRYVHKKLRSAYNSFKNNLPWLFTWYDYPEFNMPNTTNALDGHFSDLKNKLRNHNGLTIERKKKFINEIFKACRLQKSIKKRENPSLF